MKFPQGQLKETLKILAYEFVNSVQKMYLLHQENLHLNRDQLYAKVLETIEVQAQLLGPIDDCVKILQNSYEEKMKNQCFQKDFSISLQNHSVSKQSHSFDQSDCFDHKKDSFDESDDKLKKNFFNNQHAYEVTQYNHSPHENFFVVQNLIKNNQEERSESKIISEIKVQQEDQDQESQQVQSQDSDYQNSSKTNNNVKIEQYLRRRRNKIIKSSKKKYRSYTEQERQFAINEAFMNGIDITSKKLEIPKKNITRWMKRRQRSEKIRGRKPINPDMEYKLTEWIKENIKKENYLTQTEIRNKARTFSKDETFKASKGWLEKYFKRNKLISDGLNDLLVAKRIKMLQMKEQIANKLKLQNLQ